MQVMSRKGPVQGPELQAPPQWLLGGSEQK